MVSGLARESILATLMGQFFPALFSSLSPINSPQPAASPQAAGPSPIGAIPPPAVPAYSSDKSFFPPGLSAWDPAVAQEQPFMASHCWTGNYIATFLVAAAKPSDAQSVLRKGMSIDRDLAEDESYPVILGFGVFENARSLRYPFLGLNYNEFLAAIPRVFFPDGKYPYPGPYLYPYRLYLNRLMPTIFGRLSGYPKNWERVSIKTTDCSNYVFNVSNLFSGKPMLELNFSVSPQYHRIKHFSTFNQLRRLLIPNIVASGFFNIPVRSFFALDVENAVAWDVPTATLKIDDPSLFPVLPGVHTWQGIEQEFYGAVRLYLPWQLSSADDPRVELPWGIAPADTPPASTGQVLPAAS